MASCGAEAHGAILFDAPEAPCMPRSARAVPDTLLLHAQIAHRTASPPPPPPPGADDEARHALGALVAALHRCEPYAQARVYPHFGAHGGFSAVMQLLALLEHGAHGAQVHASHESHTQLLMRTLTLFTDAITRSTANLAAFLHMPGWAAVLDAVCAIRARTHTAAWLFGIAIGDVGLGVHAFGAVHAAVSALGDPSALDARPSIPVLWGACDVVHPHALERAYSILVHEDAALLTAYVLVDDLVRRDRNVVVLARTAVPALLLHTWLASYDSLHCTLVQAWRADLLRTLLRDGAHASHTLRTMVHALLASASLHAMLPVLKLLEHIAQSAHRPSALTFSSTDRDGGGGGGGAHAATLRASFPPTPPRATGYTLALVLRVEHTAGDGVLDVVRIGPTCVSMDLATSTLLFTTSAPLALPKARLVRGAWHQLVFVHMHACPGALSTLHVYLDGRRVHSTRAAYPHPLAHVPVCLASSARSPGVRSGTGAATWSLSAALLRDGVLPSCIPPLLYALLPTYTGNMQGALSRFLTYADRAKLHDGAPAALHTALERGGAECFPREGLLFSFHAAHTVSRCDGAAVLNGAVARRAAALALPHGHAVVHGVPTLCIPTSVYDALWAMGGTAVLLRLVQRADSTAALRRAVAFFLRAVHSSWRLAHDAEHCGAYNILGMHLREQRALVDRDVLAALLAAAAVDGAIVNVSLYRAVLLDACLWAQTRARVQTHYLAHFARLFGSSGAANARLLPRVALAKRVLYFARLSTQRAARLAAPLCAALQAILHASCSTRNVQSVYLFVLVASSPHVSLRERLGVRAARTDEGGCACVPAECAMHALAAPPRHDGRAEALATPLLAMLAAEAATCAEKLAHMLHPKWILLLVRPGMPRTILVPAVELLAALLAHERFAHAFLELGGYRVLERTLPLVWDAPGIVAELWALLLGARALKSSLYATYAHLPRGRLVQRPQVLRALLLCIAQGMRDETHAALRCTLRRAPPARRRSLPLLGARAALADASARHTLLHDSVRLLVRHAAHPELARILLLAPTLLCVFHAVSPVLGEAAEAPVAASVHALAMQLLDMVAMLMATSVLASGTMSLLASIHGTMPSPDPVVQSRLCSAVYEHVLKHMLPMVRCNTQPAALATLAAFVEVASNESVAHAALQRELLCAGDVLLAALRTDAAARSQEAHAHAVLALQRNVLHCFVCAAQGRRAAQPFPFLARWLPDLGQGDAVFLECVANRAADALGGAQHSAAAAVLQYLALHTPLLRGTHMEHLAVARAVPQEHACAALPFSATWAATLREQRVFLRGLHVQRLREMQRSIGQCSARAKGILATHARMQVWRAAILDADHLHFARYAQDLREDTACLAKQWHGALETLALQDGAPCDYHLDPTHGPGRMRTKLVPALERAPRASVPVLERALAELDTAQDAAADAVVLGTPPWDDMDALEAPLYPKPCHPKPFHPKPCHPKPSLPKPLLPKPSLPKPSLPKPSLPKPYPPETIPPETIPPETIPPETIPPETIPPETIPPETITPETIPSKTIPSEHPTPHPSLDVLPDAAHDNVRFLLRTLQPDDAMEDVLNVSRVLGIDTRGGLFLVATHRLYILDDYFQRPSGEIVQTLDAPPSELDMYVAATRTARAPRHAHADVRTWRWDALRASFVRAWLHRRTALELFFADGQTCLLVLASPALLARAVAHVQRKAPAAARAATHAAESVRVSRPVPHALAPARITGAVLRRDVLGWKTRAWEQGALSNAGYLMLLNTLSGRTFNDLTQYPVFPWVLADYTSSALCLDDATTFRRLDSPMGAQSAPRAAEFKERYGQLRGVAMEPFHYGTHYSTAASVCDFLVRVRPFAEHLVELQGGSFDLADRMFSSVGRAWLSASEHARSDVRELIPDFFCLPEMFLNTNGFAFGRTQAGARIDHVALPPWAHADPWLFVQLHREALESAYVSTHLHAWIDLIFGVRARGAAAVEAVNVFHPLSYADSVDLEQIRSPMERAAAAQVIYNFGQTPAPLFTQPHPARAPRAAPALGGHDADVADVPWMLMQNCVPRSTARGAVRAVHGVLPAVHGALAEQAVLPDECLLLSFGYVDNSVRFAVLGTCEEVAVAELPVPAALTAMHLVGSAYVVLGAADGVVQLCALHARERQIEPLAVWHRHRGAILCIQASLSYNMVVTGSADGTVSVWDLTRRAYVRTLCAHRAPVEHVAMDDERGWIATGADEEVCVWSINGHLLVRHNTRSTTKHALGSLAFCAREVLFGRLAVLITGHPGFLVVWDVVSHHEHTRVDAPRWRLEKRVELPTRAYDAARMGAMITCIHPSTRQTVCTGDASGDVFLWSLPGAAIAADDAACVACRTPACAKRFSLFEQRRVCASCGGVYCGACVPFVAQLHSRNCKACMATYEARGVVL
ncbi:beige protein-like 1 [Malassezia vespertilionis]|uniref:beige protein-like 1 n=1 Tax=Malassezia vespertilionis TaxID=2020962 RepID=UPI0024B0AB29|nr:beige protein-like 1 [Malassezia vespertilionis]WFD08381.1 beige protein-like 1 [Malassezia vespertilionis]